MTTEITPNQEKHLPWAGKEVRPEQIEEELTSLWHLAADNMRICQNMNVRTSVLNLVICALDTASAHKASAFLRDLPNTHIARVTLVILNMDDKLSSGVTTWITLRSFPTISDIMRHHFEQVTVELCGTAVHAAAANTIQPFLKPDLPIYLWWVSDLPKDKVLFPSLISISNRVILDSGEFSLPEEHLCTLSELLRSSSNCALSDLNWSRLTLWRELVAQFFDISEYRPYLENIEKIEIEHAVASAHNPHPLRALLLAAWLKARLGWQVADDKTQNTRDSQDGTYFWRMIKGEPKKVIEIHIGSRLQAELNPGNICLIRLTSSLHGQQAIFTINRGDDDEHVVTSVEIADMTLPQRVVNVAATHKEAELLNDELEIMGRDHLYEETLHEVFGLLS